MISDAVQMRIYANGDDTPLVETTVTGGGVFARGEFSGVVGSADCVTLDGEQGCEWQGPPGEPGTVVLTTSWAVHTVPVVFASP